ncbi:MAG: hypothetical protein LBS60_11615 [Deltaproteobacteria bacterium]|nr:hypothetical protein [Deltaproteobacteria bacterium]
MEALSLNNVIIVTFRDSARIENNGRVITTLPIWGFLTLPLERLVEFKPWLKV